MGYKKAEERPPCTELWWGYPIIDDDCYAPKELVETRHVTRIFQHPWSGRWVLHQLFVDGCTWYAPTTWCITTRVRGGMADTPA